jgi:hypothetical protein
VSVHAVPLTTVEQLASRGSKSSDISFHSPPTYLSELLPLIYEMRGGGDRD